MLLYCYILVFWYIGTFLPYSVSGVAVPLFPLEAATLSLVCLCFFCSQQAGSGHVSCVSLTHKICSHKVLLGCKIAFRLARTNRGQHCIHHIQWQFYIDLSLGRLRAKCVAYRKKVVRWSSWYVSKFPYLKSWLSDVKKAGPFRVCKGTYCPRNLLQLFLHLIKYGPSWSFWIHTCGIKL